MNDSTERRSSEIANPTAAPAPSSRWKGTLATVGQMALAGALLAGGVVFTMQQEKPNLSAASVAMLPAAVITPPRFSEESFRVAKVLGRYTSDTQAAARIADAIVSEGRKRNLDPALLVGVLLTEDDALDTMARSSVGARGLMQVMPFHAGKWGCGSSNLFSIEANICYGSSVLQDVVQRSPNMRVALLRYNGCVRGSNTPGCSSYAGKVLKAADRTAAQMLADAE